MAKMHEDKDTAAFSLDPSGCPHCVAKEIMEINAFLTSDVIDASYQDYLRKLDALPTEMAAAGRREVTPEIHLALYQAGALVKAALEIVQECGPSPSQYAGIMIRILAQVEKSVRDTQSARSGAATALDDLVKSFGKGH